jgi:hypothetical protein
MLEANWANFGLTKPKIKKMGFQKKDTKDEFRAFYSIRDCLYHIKRLKVMR